jgi:Domain of unknown function (DUF2341).
MADKSVTYNGSYILQSGMPLACYVCGDQDNVIFQPTLDKSNDETINTGTFTNTHQPLESNNVEWKKVEVNWTRSTTDKYNMLEQNQANCCEDGTTTGFGINGNGTVTLSADSTQHDTGNYSLKVICDGTNGGQGMGTNTLMSITPGNTYSVKARVKGSGNVIITLCERDDTGQFIGNEDVSSAAVTLTSSWQDISLTKTIPVGTKLRMKVQTNSAQAVTFWVDSIIVNCGNVASWVEDKTSFNANISLYGIMHDGEPELIGEYNTSEISPTSITESAIFDLCGGAGEPPLTKELGVTASGKLKLKLPMTLDNYESVILKHTSYADEWTKVKTLPVTGTTSTYTYPNYVIGPYVISYDSDMNSDFSDLRFAIWNGAGYTDCDYYLFSKTDGVSATVFIEIPNLPISPSIVNIYMFYGNPNATTQSNSAILVYYDDFEDGKYTGRSSPYRNWTCSYGTISTVSSGQLGGNYSLKHVGGNAGTIPVYFASNLTAQLADFNFKLLTQGTGANDPYVNLWNIYYIDSSNRCRLDTYYNGTQQVLRIVQTIGGTSSVLATFTWRTGKWPVNEQHSYKVAYNPPSITVWMDVTKIFDNVNIGTYSNNDIGFGCLQSASGLWDNIRVRSYLSNFRNSDGSEATIGTLSSEGTEVSPDSWDDTKQELLFTLPGDYLSGCPICFDIDEMDSSPYETPDITPMSTNVFRLGYDHTSKYHALRVVVETNAGATENITFNYIKYDYEV